MGDKVMTQERDQLFSKADAIVDTYHSGGWDINSLLEMRRDLASLSWRLASMSKSIYGGAGLSYLVRKWEIAKHIVNARSLDAKKPLNMLEAESSKVPSVVEAQKKEVEADAEREQFKLRMEQFKQVLASMQQDISYLAQEQRTTRFQETSHQQR